MHGHTQGGGLFRQWTIYAGQVGLPAGAVQMLEEEQQAALCAAEGQGVVEEE
jgi:hypothetical protein